MSTIIEELFYGNLDPKSEKNNLTAEIKRKLKILVEKEEQFNTLLNDEEKELLSVYSELYGNLLSLSCAEAFVTGYKYGARFTYEAFVG